MTAEKTQGLTCPNCTAVVQVPEGIRIIQCSYCQQRSLVQGERGVRRWQVSRKVEREQALEDVKGFFFGLNKALDLKSKAEIRELFLVYLPYWRVTAFVAGWMFGRIKVDDDDTEPVEVSVMEDMYWNDAATDVSEFGVHRVSLTRQDLQPYDSEILHREAMVFEPSESRTEAMSEAEFYFTSRARTKQNLDSKYFEKFHTLQAQLSMVYYPLWVARYEYKQRNYQVVVDGVKGDVLYGKAPGNIFYRAAALVLGMAVGNFILVNGLALVGTMAAVSGNSSSNDEGSFALIFVPLAISAAMIFFGYQAFRYGEEVEQIQPEAKKAGSTSISGVGDFFKFGLEILDDL